MESIDIKGDAHDPEIVTVPNPDPDEAHRREQAKQAQAAHLEAARNKVTAAERKVEKAEKDVEDAKAAVDVAKAELAELEGRN